MPRLYKVSGVIWRRLQDLALYRCIRRLTASGIILRQATDTDRLAVYGWHNPNSDPAHDVQHNPDVTNWVAEYHGQLAGFVQLVRHLPEHAPYTGYWLFSLHTKPCWQGLGIGERLSQAVIARARLEGAPMLNLVVYENNVRAIRLYLKLGFEMHTLPELEPQLEGERASTGRRRVVMRKRLADHP
jgi:ribosomal protein S18 acetylase RimI-like enzyme